MGRGLPINIRTRGEPNEYQNIGLLKNTNPDKSNDVKPLYGRRVYRGSNMWNYYTVLNDHIQVKLPIMRTNNCLDERGCSEIQSGEEITVNNKKYITELYPYSDFRYIPYGIIHNPAITCINGNKMDILSTFFSRYVFINCGTSEIIIRKVPI